MKNVLVILAGSLLAITAKAQMPSPVDSLKISKDVSLDEVVITATKVGKETPVAYSDISKQELSSRNNGQGIPFLISQSPSVIMTSDAGTGIGYSGFRIRGTDANRINITINGVPVNDSESHTVFWANMADIASSVESIQIQRGAGTSTNGAAAFGATVAMQTETVLKALRRIFRISRFFRYAETYGKRRHRITLRSFRFRRPLLQYP